MALVGAAADYFDHSLEEAILSGELNTPAGKSKLVGRIAPPLALVQDAVLRESILGRICSRLSLPHAVIRSAMKAPSPDSGNERGVVSLAEPVEKITLSAGMHMLCQIALASSEVRVARTQAPAVAFEPGGALVDKLTQAEFESGSTTLPTALLSTLTAAEERTLSSLDTRRPMPAPLERAKLTWQGLLIQQFTQKMEGLKSQLIDPSVSVTEREKFKNKYLTLKSAWQMFSGPFELA